MTMQPSRDEHHHSNMLYQHNNIDQPPMNEQRSTDAPIVINHVQRQAFAQQQRQASSQFMQTQVQPLELQSN